MFNILVLGILVVLSLKIYEMGNHCYRILRYGTKQGVKAVTDVEHWPITSRLVETKSFHELPSCGKIHFFPKAILGLMFRLPCALTAIYLLLIGLPKPTEITTYIIWCLVASLMFLAVWIQISQALFSKLVFRTDDSQFRHLSTRFNSGPNFQKGFDNELIEIVVFMAGLIYVTIIAYAGLYRAWSVLRPSDFCGLNNMGDALYFSMVTFATVGYGDILPSGLWARLLCVTQILTSICIVGLFVFAYSFDRPSAQPAEKTIGGKTSIKQVAATKLKEPQ